METILSQYSASISELKRNPTALLKEAKGSPIAILNHNRPTAYLVPTELYETMMDIIEDYELGLLVKEREEEKELAFEVDINDL
jgi:antitoxin StbD